MCLTFVRVKKKPVPANLRWTFKGCRSFRTWYSVLLFRENDRTTVNLPGRWQKQITLSTWSARHGNGGGRSGPEKRPTWSLEGVPTCLTIYTALFINKASPLPPTPPRTGKMKKSHKCQEMTVEILDGWSTHALSTTKKKTKGEGWETQTKTTVL